MSSIEDKLMTASQIKEVTDTKLDKDFSNSDINPSVLTNLGSTSADDILKASPRPGVTGVLPLVNGGVGSSTAAGARTNLDVYSKSETNTAIQQSTASDWSGVNSWMSDTERGSCIIAYFGKVLQVTFMTNSRVHAEGDVIMTLPESWCPRFNVDIPVFYRNGCCVLRIGTSGVMTIWILNDTTNAGRIYGNFTLIVP